KPIKKYFTLHPPLNLPKGRSAFPIEYKANIKPYFILLCSTGQEEIELGVRPWAGRPLIGRKRVQGSGFKVQGSRFKVVVAASPHFR
ncbi:MAG: hypothetical protein SPE67_00955, partial [Dialister sp.]|nr:hypothetical protein [Dialister sp.]